MGLGAGMQCYEHNDRPAVATCSNGCGRSLCSECCDRFVRPTCSVCVRVAHAGSLADKAAEIDALQQEINFSKLIAVCGVLGLAMSVVSLIVGPLLFHQHVFLEMIFRLLGGIPLLPVIYWGFKAFKGIGETISEVTGLIFFSNLSTCCLIYYIGSVMIAGFWYIFLPIQMYFQNQKMKKLLEEFAEISPQEPQDSGW